MSACDRCERPMPDQAFACVPCRDRAIVQLVGDPGDDRAIGITDGLAAARDVAHGQARRGPGGAGGAEPRLELNFSATSRLDAVQNALTTWVRQIAAERGLAVPRPQHMGDDVIAVAARWLVGHGNVEWIRHRRDAEEFLADVDECAGVVRRIARGPAEQKYLGPCGAPTQAEVTTFVDPEPVFVDGKPCEGDVYGPRGGSIGRCRLCGSEVAQRDREAWLDGEVRSHAFRAAQIAEAYGVNVNTIRSWAARGQLRSFWAAGDQLLDWGDPVDDEDVTERGHRLHLVGDVLDLAAADAARRATEQAKRARRDAIKAAGDGMMTR